MRLYLNTTTNSRKPLGQGSTNAVCTVYSVMSSTDDDDVGTMLTPRYQPN